MAEVQFTRATSGTRIEEYTLWIHDEDIPKWQAALQKRTEQNAVAQNTELRSQRACVRDNPVERSFEDSVGFHACLQAKVNAYQRALVAADTEAWKKVKPLIVDVVEKKVRFYRPVPVSEQSSLLTHRRLTGFGLSKEPLPDVVFVSAYPLNSSDRFLTNANDFYSSDWQVTTKTLTSFDFLVRSLARSKTGGGTVFIVTHALGRNVLLPLFESGHPSNLLAHINALLESNFAYYKYVLFELAPAATLRSAFSEILDGVIRYLRASQPRLYDRLLFGPKLEDLLVIEAIRKAVPTGQFVFDISAAANRHDLEVQYERVLGRMFDIRASELRLGRALQTLSDSVVDWLNSRASSGVVRPIFTMSLDAEQYDRVLKNATAAKPDALNRLRSNIANVQAKPPTRVCVRGCKISRATLQGIATCLGVSRGSIDAPNALYHGYVPAAINSLYIEDNDFQSILGRPGTTDSLMYWAKLTRVEREISEWALTSPARQLDLYLDYAMVLPSRKEPLVLLARRFTEPPAPPMPGRNAMKAYLEGMWDASDPHRIRIRRRAEAITKEWETNGYLPICPAMMDDLTHPTQFVFVHDPQFADNVLTAR
jgi:hypothetical protein